MNHLLPVAITVWALAAVGSGYLIVLVAGAVNAAVRSPEPPTWSLRKASKDLAGGVIAFGLLGSIAVLALSLLSAALIEAGAPKVIYPFTGLAAAFLVWRGVAHSSYGMEGCTKGFLLCWGAYGLSWSVVSLWLIPEATPSPWSIGAVARPLVVAAPPALLAYGLSGDRRKLAQGLGVFVSLAALAALVFFPMEGGLARSWLPRSDWVRFPLVGMIAAVGLTLLPQMAQARAAWRSASDKRRKRIAQNALRVVALFAAFGALLGFFWAVTRAIDVAI